MGELGEWPAVCLSRAKPQTSQLGSLRTELEEARSLSNWSLGLAPKHFLEPLPTPNPSFLPVGRAELARRLATSPHPLGTPSSWPSPAGWLSQVAPCHPWQGKQAGPSVRADSCRAGPSPCRGWVPCDRWPIKERSAGRRQVFVVHRAARLEPRCPSQTSPTFLGLLRHGKQWTVWGRNKRPGAGQDGGSSGSAETVGKAWPPPSLELK